MDDFIGFMAVLGIPALLIFIGWLVGRITEGRHFAKLQQREAAMSHMLLTDLRRFPAGAGPAPTPQILVGEVVIGADYFKSFVARMKKLIGGRLGTYQTLMERARREAILRILEQAHQQGYDAVCNIRIEAADVGGANTTQQNKAKAVMVAIIASATAYHRLA